jgi:hypothetical protein
MATSNSKNRSQSERAVSTIAFCILGGILGILLFALETSSFTQFFSVFGAGLLIAGASLLSGGLLGFLFGIPRTLQQERAEGIPSREQKEQATDNTVLYQVNTNLEQISDWLTKILVGVGLTQITSLPGAIQKYAEFASPGLGGGPASKSFAAAILIFYLVCGFLIGYLWTRLYLAGALRQADLATVGDKIARVEDKVSELERQADIDAKALSIIQRQLNPGPGSPPISQEDINSAIMSASRNVKAQIYYLAHDTRSLNWRERQNKPTMERTIPIFRALIASDTEDVYHLNHGQLGFALKDQREPNWSEAEAEFTKAIKIRGSWQEKGWLLYEYCRAVCRINLDQAFSQGKVSSDESKNQILEDLKAAANAPQLVDFISEEPVIKKWLTLNKVKRLR